MTDLIISGNNCSINCWTTRYTTDDLSIKIETFMKKSDLQLLNRSVTPGAIDEAYNILGRSHYYDTTFQGNNTLKLIPIHTNEGKLEYMRGDRTIIIKNMTSEPVSASNEYLNVVLEGYLEGEEVI